MMLAVVIILILILIIVGGGGGGGVEGEVVDRGFALAAPDDPHGQGIPRLFVQTADDVFGSFVVWMERRRRRRRSVVRQFARVEQDQVHGAIKRRGRKGAARRVGKGIGDIVQKLNFVVRICRTSWILSSGEYKFCTL